MIPREVTVGRASDCDILYSPNQVYVSNKHALIYSNGEGLFYKDMSSNGTVINGNMVHHRTVPIKIGDSILLANKYPLTWDKILMYFPQEKQPTKIYPSSPGSTGTIINPQTNVIKQDEKNTMKIELEINKFNWGAFFLYPLWGFANGMWWTFLIAMFCWWTFIIPNIIFGIKGSKWAWENKKWRDINHFITVQDSWKKWGIGVFLANIFLTLIYFIILSDLFL